MRRPISSDSDDDKNNVTIKSMILSMIRVCSFFTFHIGNILLKKTKIKL